MNKIVRKDDINMVPLDKLRVTKLKCLSCGCRDKRVAILNSKLTQKRIGFATICCNCGHIKRYNFRRTKEWKGKLLNNSEIVEMLQNQIYVSEIFCVIPDMFCPNKGCDLKKSCPCKEDITYEDLLKGKYPGEIVREPEMMNLKIQEKESKGKFI